MKKIYKYPTGEYIPEGAVYLNTVTQTKIWDEKFKEFIPCWLVWHYFLVEVAPEKDKKGNE